jgi:hypothetical protein
MPEQAVVSGAKAPTPFLLFLDQFVWVRLAQSRKTGDPSYSKLLQLLLRTTAEGSLSVPLAATSYLELWHRASDTSRHEVAVVMRDVSRYATLLAFHVLQEQEIAEASKWFVGDRRGEPVRVPRDRVVGFGANHAFGSPTGRFRFIESLATPEFDEGAPVDVPVEFLEMARGLSPREWEWVNLAGMPGLHNVPGVEIRPEHRIGDAYVKIQEARRRFVSTSDDPSLLFRDIIGYHLVELGEAIAANLSDEDLLANFRSPSDGASFVSRIPSLDVKTRIEQAAHRNPQYRFRQHDRADVLAVSQTMPYCDAIWVDAQWTDMSRRSKCDVAYDTHLVGKVDEAIALVEGL